MFVCLPLWICNIPIKVVARRTGLSQHAIRVWEKRYNAVEPSRTDSNRRLYSDAEIHRLQVLCQLTQSGHSIGRIARLPLEQLQILARQTVPPETLGVGRRAETVKSPDSGTADYLGEAMTAIRALDQPGLEEILHLAAVELGNQGFLQRFVAPLVAHLGTEWESGSLKVAHEHFASSVLCDFLQASSRSFALPESAPLLIVATPAGQFHEIGAVMVMAASKNRGWRVIYLGGNLPAHEIASAVSQSKARAVALSIVYPPDDPQLAGELAILRRNLPAEVPILAGGRAAPSYADVLAATGAHLLDDLNQLHRTLDDLRSSGPRPRVRAAT
jgi:DNA-binding transcriptional MerR regulator/methylmalonyl-CoA mutase cobalamin-binding subunit